MLPTPVNFDQNRSMSLRCPACSRRGVRLDGKLLSAMASRCTGCDAGVATAAPGWLQVSVGFMEQMLALPVLFAIFLALENAWWLVVIPATFLPRAILLLSWPLHAVSRPSNSGPAASLDQKFLV